MKRIAVPTRSAEDWKRLLAQPGLHWKAGYSAMTLALSWEAAHPSAWFDDFVAFAKLFGVTPGLDEVVYVGEHGGVPLWVGWCCGDQRFREMVQPGWVATHRGGSR